MVIFMVKSKNDISAIKRAKKRNLQITLMRPFHKIGLPFSFFPCVFFSGESSVQYPDTTVIPHTIICCYLGQTSLKRMIQSRNFVPPAQIFLYLEIFDGSYILRYAHTSR